MISCREVIGLSSLAKLNIVAGKTGLDRVMRWVHFIDLPDVIHWVQGGELLIITGIGLNGDESRLIDIVHGIIKKKLAGLIVNIGPYIQKIPDEVIRLANQADFPIFELPWEVKLIEVTQEICSYIVIKQTEQQSIKDFLEQLLFCPLANPEMLIQRAAYYGCDLADAHQVAIIRPANLTKFSQGRQVKDEKSQLALKVRFGEIIRDSLNMQEKKNLQMMWADDAVLLMPYENEGRGALQNTAILTEILEKIAAGIPGLAATAALGGSFEGLQSARGSYLQALKVLRFAELKIASRTVYSYDQLGLCKLLFDIEPGRLTLYYQEVIEPLNEYDDKHHMDMAASLFVYF